MTNDEQKRVEEIRELTEVYCLRNAAQALRELPFLLDLVERQEEKASSLTAALADRNAEIERLEALVDGLRCAETYYLGYKAALAKAEKRANAAVADMEFLVHQMNDTVNGNIPCHKCSLYPSCHRLASCPAHGYSHFDWNDPTE